MDANVVATLISVGGVVLSAIISCVCSMSLVNWRLSQLEKKIDEHNKYSDKIASICTDIALIKQSIESLKEK